MKRIFLGFICLNLMFSTAGRAQEETNDIPDPLPVQFQDLIDNSETFQQYKVIPIVKMNAFKVSLTDTLNRYKANIKQAKDEKNAVSENNDSLQAKVAKLKIELAETQKLVDGIQFFGITLTKSVYNLIMWGVVVGLVIVLVILYLAFMNANRVAKQSKNDKLRVDDELEELRKTAHEKQVKVKRELQTALNKIDELSK